MTPTAGFKRLKMLLLSSDPAAPSGRIRSLLVTCVRLYRADTVASLPQAFAAIAGELRTQYLLGYYPTNKNEDGTYRKIQVKTTRQDIAVRARPGYRPKNGQ